MWHRAEAEHVAHRHQLRVNGVDFDDVIYLRANVGRFLLYCPFRSICPTLLLSKPKLEDFDRNREFGPPPSPRVAEPRALGWIIFCALRLASFVWLAGESAALPPLRMPSRFN
jgi:hypothetical protein